MAHPVKGDRRQRFRQDPPAPAQPKKRTTKKTTTRKK